MTEDEVTAFHEAAHAVFAVSGRWTRLSGPVAITRDGCGDVVMSTDGDAIRKTLIAESGFDRERPRIELIGALLAGPIAERMLCERGLVRFDERDLSAASRGDRDVIAEQVSQIVPPRPGLLEALERDVRRRLEQPPTWSAIEGFAAILLERRRLEAAEATEILEGMRPYAAYKGARSRRFELSPVAVTLTVLAGFAITAILRLLG